MSGYQDAGLVTGTDYSVTFEVAQTDMAYFYMFVDGVQVASATDGSPLPEGKPGAYCDDDANAAVGSCVFKEFHVAFQTATASTNTICGDCGPDHYSTGTNVSACARKQSCAVGKENVGNNANSAGSCQNCAAGTYSDRITIGANCTECSGPNYVTGADGSHLGGTACEPLGSCGTGSGNTNTSNTAQNLEDVSCEACTAGFTYSSVDDQSECQPATSCGNGEGNNNATASSPGSCSTCSDSTYHWVDDVGGTDTLPCESRAVCPQGQGNNSGSTAHYGECVTCSSGEYSDANDTTACQSCATYWTSNSNNTDCVADTSQDGDGDGIASAHDDCPDMPAYSTCANPNLKGKTSSGSISGNPVFTSSFNVSSLTQAPLYGWGGMKDEGDISWHKIDIYPVSNSSSSRRDHRFLVRFFDTTGSSNSHYTLDVYTPQTHTNACPNNESFRSTGSSSNRTDNCQSRHDVTGTAAVYTDSGFANQDMWEWGDTSENNGYQGGTGYGDTRFTSSSVPMPDYIKVRVIKTSGGGSCSRYHIRADMDTGAPYDAASSSSCMSNAYGYCWNDVAGNCQTEDGFGWTCADSCSAMAPVFNEYDLDWLVETMGVCWLGN